jgi:hypothetical protein
MMAAARGARRTIRCRPQARRPIRSGRTLAMAWFSRITRFGDLHLVYGQEANMTCGIASVMMCIFKVNKLTPGSTAVTVEKKIIDKYESLLGSNYDPENVGTYPQHLATILSSFTGGTWRAQNPGANGITKMLIDKVGVSSGFGPTLNVTPVIIGVDWNQGGAHWVVVDTIRKVGGTHYATVCDPWDTNVHIQKFSSGSPFSYSAGNGGVMVNFGGTNKGESQPYDKASNGVVSTWGMIAPI